MSVQVCIRMLDVLVAARKLIEKPENWTKDTYARDSDRNPIWYIDPKACTFCLVGAVCRVLGLAVFTETIYDRILIALREILFELYGARYDGPAEFNDDPDTSHEKVLELIDKTIERLKSQGLSRSITLSFPV